MERTVDSPTVESHTVGAKPAQRVYAELLERVGEAHPRPRIEPVRRLAELAGSPQLSFPVIQIAGTNGKTSTSRAIESILRAHGLRTGLFTSPHLIDFTERFQIDGEPIGGAMLADAWDELQIPLQIVDTELQEAGQGPITFFEALAVLAFAAFADAPVEVAVLEVGMGGEWDATNIADAQVAVFTPIDLDHAAILGPEIADIARTKAGIVKQGAIAVSSAQHLEALTQVIDAVEREDARLLLADRDFALVDDRLAVGGRQIVLRGLHGHEYEPLFVPLYGQHQTENVATAVVAVEAFLGGERPIPGEVLHEGLASLTSPGRLQLIGTEPSVLIDAAHNPHGAEALVRALTESFDFNELAVVVGVLAEKDAAGLLEVIAPVASVLITTPVDSPRSVSAAQLESLALATGEAGEVRTAAHLHAALDDAREWAREAAGRGVLVVGSVLLAGEALQHSRQEGWGIA